MNENQIYVVSVVDRDYETLEKLFCVGMDNVHKTANQMKDEYPGCSVFYNKAATCFDGYLVTGEYVSSI